TARRGIKRELLPLEKTPRLSWGHFSGPWADQFSGRPPCQAAPAETSGRAAVLSSRNKERIRKSRRTDQSRTRRTQRRFPRLRPRPRECQAGIVRAYLRRERIAVAPGTSKVPTWRRTLSRNPDFARTILAPGTGPTHRCAETDIPHMPV